MFKDTGSTGTASPAEGILMDSTKTRKFTKRSLPPEIKIAIGAGQAKKGEDILVLDLREVSTFTDVFVIMHGNSSRQNAALADAIAQDLKAAGRRPLGVEGMAHGEWILMDFGNFIIHIFSKQARMHYALEKLWGDAPRLEM
jgi:ribosome-associated protein